MHVLVTGASGLIGTALTRALTARGDTVTRLVRGSVTGPDEKFWDPGSAVLDPSVFHGVDAVVHLAGAGIGDKKWTDARKAEILDSRTQGTSLLARVMVSLPTPPQVLVSASAVGYYGDRGDEVLTEASGPGDDFTAGICTAWEGAASGAADSGARVACLRTGIVLDAKGGALARMLLPFKLGIGGRLGTGNQYMSWITLHDEVAAIVHVLDSDLAGAVNLVAPNPVTNLEFTETLGRVLRRPTFLPTPLAPLKLRYGAELVESLLLVSQRAVPEMLTERAGFTFAHPDLESGLRSVLGR